MALKSISFVLMLAGCLIGANSWAVNMFESENNSGTSIGIAGQEEECVPIPKFFTGKSLDVRDFCVNLYESDDCTGNKYAFLKGTSSSSNLQQVTQKRIGSVKSCNTDY